MHAVAHGGCADTVRESALKADTERKIPRRTGESNPRQYCACFFFLNRTLYQLSYSRPLKYLLLLSFPPVNFQCRLGTRSQSILNSGQQDQQRQTEITLRTTATLIMKTTTIIIIITRRRKRRRNDNDGNTSYGDDVGDTEINSWRRKRLSFGRKMKPFSIVATWRRQR